MTRNSSVKGRNAADAEALATSMRSQRYLKVRILPDGTVAALADLLYTRSIVLGCHWEGWATRYCFEDRAIADQEFSKLRSEDDVPTGHIAKRDGFRAR